MSDNKKTFVLDVKVRVYAPDLSTAATIIENRLCAGHRTPSMDPDCVQVDEINAKVQPRGK